MHGGKMNKLLQAKIQIIMDSICLGVLTFLLIMGNIVTIFFFYYFYHSFWHSLAHYYNVRDGLPPIFFVSEPALRNKEVRLY